MQGEKLASGNARITLLLPFGRITLVRSSNPLDIIRIESPSELYATVVHPQIELKLLIGIKTNYFIEKCYYSMGKCGRTSWFTDYELIGRSLHDEIVEPLRSVFLALI
jgi:homoserine kinase